MEIATLISLLHTMEKGDGGVLSYIVMIGVTILCIYHVYHQMNDTKKQTATIKEMLEVTEETKEQVLRELHSAREKLNDCQEGQNELHDKIAKLNSRLAQYADELQELRDKMH